MSKILVCEDELSIRSFVVVNLRRAGYEVVEAGSGEEALELYRRDPSVAIALLDVMMPGIDGFETCRRLREMNGTMGIIMLTARTQEAAKVNGLKMGADDYVTKPFGIAELLARIAALDRRLSSTAGVYLEEMYSGDFTLNVRTRQLCRSGEPIELTQMEYQMMECFFRNPQQPLSRTELLHKVWGEDYVGEEKVVDVNIRRLRMKIEADASDPRHICTIWGKGYQWNG